TIENGFGARNRRRPEAGEDGVHEHDRLCTTGEPSPAIGGTLEVGRDEKSQPTVADPPLPVASCEKRLHRVGLRLDGEYFPCPSAPLERIEQESEAESHDDEETCAGIANPESLRTRGLTLV